MSSTVPIPADNGWLGRLDADERIGYARGFIAGDRAAEVYALSRAQLNREVVRCRRDGWQLWELRAAFGSRR